MTSRRSFLRSLSLLPLAPSILSEAATAAVIPEPPHYYHYEKVDAKMNEFMKRYESAIMAGEYSGPSKITNI